MRLRNLAVLCVLSLLSFVSATAQDYLYATGTPIYSTSLPIDNGVLNVNNGEIHLEFPLSTKQQRGDLVLNKKLIYDSRIWKIVQNGGSYSWQPNNVANSSSGWTLPTNTASQGSITYYTGTGQYPNTCSDAAGATKNYSWYYNWVWTEANGTKHTFPTSTSKYGTGGPDCNGDVLGNPQSGAPATDGSGYRIAIDNYTATTIYDIHGTAYYPSVTGGSSPAGSNTTDRNGNFWSTDSNGNLVDTSGTAPMLTSSSGNQTFYDVLGVGGGRQRYTITMGLVSFNTAFNQVGIPNEASGSFYAVQSVDLPDGSSYTFTYDSGISPGHFGELTSMRLPTGGTVTYNYSNFLDSFSNQNEWISSIVRDGASTVFTPAVVSTCTSSAGCQETTTVHNPHGDETLYTFNLDQAGLIAGSSWTQGIKSYQGTVQSGHLLRSTGTSYVYNQGTISAPYGTKTVVVGNYETPYLINQMVTLADVNLTSQTQTTLANSTPLAGEVKVWDFGASLSGSPTTDTVNLYTPLNFSSSVLVKDGAGNRLSSTTYGYDESPVTASSGVPSHAAAPGAQRGNQTSQHQWINTTGQALDTTMTYDDAGTLLTSTTPEGKTTYTYDSTDTFVTGTTAPTPSSGAVLTAGAAYDASTGAVTSTTDPNGNAASYKSFDAFNRAGQINYPDGGITTVSYPSPTTVNESTAFNSTGNGTTMKQNDAYGRPSRAAVATGQGSTYYQQDTCYDVIGHVQFQSYRYQGSGFSGAKVCTGAGDSYTYDALGRTTRVTHGDGTGLTYSYAGRAVKTTDENGVSKISQSDAFGRITTACEVSSDATMPNSGSPAACGTDIAGTGFVTSYS